MTSRLTNGPSIIVFLPSNCSGMFCPFEQMFILTSDSDEALCLPKTTKLNVNVLCNVNRQKGLIRVRLLTPSFHHVPPLSCLKRRGVEIIEILSCSASSRCCNTNLKHLSDYGFSVIDVINAYSSILFILTHSNRVAFTINGKLCSWMWMP